MKQIITAILALWVSGCSSFRSVQTDMTDKAGVRTVKTEVRARTLFDSKSELSKLTATTTEKTQRIGIGSLAQESSATNAVALIEAVVGAAVKAAAGK